MAHKMELSKQRENIVINNISKYQEIDCNIVIDKIIKILECEFNVKLVKENSIKLKDIVDKLKVLYPDEDFFYYYNTSNMKPDGGLVYLVDKDMNKYPILITEVKNQGTNDMRIAKGLKPQSLGNAIEKLGKNVIGLRTYLLNESIFPFVCFGYGYDFKEGSSILDRVVTIAMFGKLNTTYLYNNGPFNRGSFYFRHEAWKNEEMYEILYKIAKSSIYYYFSKYGDECFMREHN